MLSKKGQVLVVFVLILPLVLFFLALVIDYGNLYLKKREIENRVKYVVEENFKYSGSDDVEAVLESLLKNNISGLKKYEINASEVFIVVSVTVEIKRIFPIYITGENDFKLTYRGYKENGKIIIEKE